MYNTDLEMNEMNDTTGDGAKPSPQIHYADGTQIVNCICAAEMKLIVAKDCYDGDGVWCDGCRKSICDTDLLYHCPVGFHSAHRDGYDICTDCASEQWDSSDVAGMYYFSY